MRGCRQRTRGRRRKEATWQIDSSAPKPPPPLLPLLPPPFERRGFPTPFPSSPKCTFQASAPSSRPGCCTNCDPCKLLFSRHLARPVTRPGAYETVPKIPPSPFLSRTIMGDFIYSESFRLLSFLQNLAALRVGRRPFADCSAPSIPSPSFPESTAEQKWVF